MEPTDGNFIFFVFFFFSPPMSEEKGKHTEKEAKILDSYGWLGKKYKQ